jgi:hypothetical protein
MSEASVRAIVLFTGVSLAIVAAVRSTWSP